MMYILGICHRDHAQIDTPFSASEALTEASQLAVTFQVLDLTQHQVPIIFSEDFQDGRTLEGAQFANPFLSEFNLWVT